MMGALEAGAFRQKKFGEGFLSFFSEYLVTTCCLLPERAQAAFFMPES